MALVDYPSSDSDSEKPPAAPVLARKKPAGPKKILLDLPKPASPSVDADEPPKKRPKFAFSGTSGLGSMLPAPVAKAPSPTLSQKAPQKAVSAGDEDDAEREALRAILGDGSTAPKVKSPLLVPPKVAASKTVTDGAAPAVSDFFGLGSSSAASGSPRNTKVTVSGAPLMSAAPKTVDKEPSPPPANYYATLPPPSAANPYPGFHALSSGRWVADRPDEWTAWCAMNNLTASGQVINTPASAANEDLVDVEGVGTSAGGLEESKIPSKIVDLQKIPEKARVMGGRGGNKHQLSSLLYQAHANRAELEDKIAQAKQNRKAGSQKYGF